MHVSYRGLMRMLPILLPALVGCLLYLPSLSFDRTLDDLVQVPAPHERTLQTWTEVWTQPYWRQQYAGGGLFRPVTSATFWIESKLASPLWVRHLANVFLYALVTGLVARVGVGLGFPALAAMAGGLLFALHPTHVEAVAGLVGRAELLAALWILIALLLHDRWLRAPKPLATWLPAFALVAFLAAGSKESAWMLALFVLPLHAARRKPLRQAAPAFAGYAIGLLAHLLLRRHALGGWINAPDVRITPIDNQLIVLHGLDRFLGGLRVAGVFLGHLVLPRQLSPDYSGPTISISGSLLDPPFLGGCLLLIGIPALLLLGWRARSSPWGIASLAAGVWIGTAFLLTMNVFFNLATTLADRLLFWPSAGWTLWIGATLVASRRHARAARAILGVVIAAVLCAYGATAIAYLPAWKNNLTLFDHARRVTPLSARVWSAYGRALGDAGKYQEALDALHQSEHLSPGYPLPWSQEAALLINLNRLDEAKAPLAEALRRFPGDPASRVNEAIIWFHEGRTKEVIPRLNQILLENPHQVQARRYLALALEQEGTPAEAQAAWRTYLELAPSDATALNALARILAVEPEGAPEAERLARRALEIDPKTPQYRDTLGEALFHQDKFSEAAAAWRDYLNQAPDDANVLNDLAWILATRLDKAADAEALARRAVQITPGNPGFRDTLAESLWRQGKTEEAARVAREALALEGSSPDLKRFLPGGKR